MTHIFYTLVNRATGLADPDCCYLHGRSRFTDDKSAHRSDGVLKIQGVAFLRFYTRQSGKAKTFTGCCFLRIKQHKNTANQVFKYSNYLHVYEDFEHKHLMVV